MKKISIFLLLFFCSFITRTYAAYGNAKDGDVFAIVLIGFLLLLAGILFGIDYLRKNGKRLIRNLFRPEPTPQKQEGTDPFYDFTSCHFTI